MVTRPCSDVLILGGGPAGSAAAITLASAGVRTVIVERSQYDRFRVGETLPPEAMVPLARLGVTTAVLDGSHVASPGTVAAWGVEAPYENDFIFSPHGNGWHLDRRHFDAALASAAMNAGAEVIQGVQLATAMRSQDNTWTLRGETATGPFDLRARWVIDATGRSAWLARRSGSERRVHNQLVGIGGVCRRSPGGDPRTFVEAQPEGWWYSAELPGGRAIVVYFTDADLVCGLRRTMEERWTDLLQNTRLTKQQLADGRPDRPLLVRPASSTIAEPVVGNRWLTVGDAACTIDPLSSQGIVRALTTGIEAAEALMETSPEEAVKRYAANVTLWYQNYLNTRRQFYAREGRWPDSPFWRRGSGSTVGPAAGARSAAKESTVA